MKKFVNGCEFQVAGGRGIWQKTQDTSHKLTEVKSRTAGTQDVKVEAKSRQLSAVEVKDSPLTTITVNAAEGND